MKLYHCTTQRKAKKYRQTGYICSPVRGFDSLTAAMAWSLSLSSPRQIILEIDIPDNLSVYKLPDHHNQWGCAWWIEGNIPVENYKCIYSPEKV